MSAFDPKQTWAVALHESAFGGKADMDVRFSGRYWVQSGHGLMHCTCPLMTQSGHLQEFDASLAMYVRYMGRTVRVLSYFLENRVRCDRQ